MTTKRNTKKKVHIREGRSINKKRDLFVFYAKQRRKKKKKTGAKKQETKKETKDRKIRRGKMQKPLLLFKKK